jgi:hypothetical protein
MNASGVAIFSTLWNPLFIGLCRGRHVDDFRGTQALDTAGGNGQNSMSNRTFIDLRNTAVHTAYRASTNFDPGISFMCLLDRFPGIPSFADTLQMRRISNFFSLFAIFIALSLRERTSTQCVATKFRGHRR